MLECGGWGLTLRIEDAKAARHPTAAVGGMFAENSEGRATNGMRSTRARRLPQRIRRRPCGPVGSRRRTRRETQATSWKAPFEWSSRKPPELGIPHAPLSQHADDMLVEDEVRGEDVD